MAAEPSERPNRRATDAHVEGLRVLVGGLENRVVVLEEDNRATRREIRENTTITTQTKERVDEMYALLETARSAFRLAGKVGAGGLWVVDKAGKIRAGHLIIAAAGFGAYLYLKNGKLPDWFLPLVSKLVAP